MPSALSDLEILQSRSLSKAVQDEILRLIQEGAFEAGQQLREVDVAKRLGVSRGPVREAFRGLEEAKLLRLTKNRGVSVREITKDEAFELYQLRAGLDGIAGELLAPNITDPQVVELNDLIAEMDMIIAKGDAAGYFSRNIGFHDRIVEMSGNGKLLEIYRRLMNEMHLMRRHGIVHGGAALSNQEHRRIVDALTDRDTVATTTAMREHVMSGMNRFMSAPSEDADSGQSPAKK
jgi:DNA-binding GntR family transcriptional regulator